MIISDDDRKMRKDDYDPKTKYIYIAVRPTSIEVKVPTNYCSISSDKYRPVRHTLIHTAPTHTRRHLIPMNCAQPRRRSIVSKAQNTHTRVRLHSKLDRSRLSNPIARLIKHEMRSAYLYARARARIRTHMHMHKFNPFAAAVDTHARIGSCTCVARHCLATAAAKNIPLHSLIVWERARSPNCPHNSTNALA